MTAALKLHRADYEVGDESPECVDNENILSIVKGKRRRSGISNRHPITREEADKYVALFFKKRGIRVPEVNDRRFQLVRDVRIGGKNGDPEPDEETGMDMVYSVIGFDHRKFIAMHAQCFRLGIPMENSMGVILVYLEVTRGVRFES